MGDYIKKYKTIMILLIIASFFSVTTGSAYADGNNMLEDVKQILKIYYVKDLPESVYAKTSIEDVLKEVNKTDPYTKYYSENTYKVLINKMNNDNSGIGVYIQMVTDGARVVTVLDNSVEKAAGLKPDDVILMVDNHILLNTNEDTAIRYIKGEPGSTVVLKVKRGTSLITTYISREAPTNSTVDGRILDGHIGYIKINAFGEDSDSLFSQKIQEDENLKVDGYIIDLRYNGGGFVNVACDIAGYFVGNNVALITKGKLTGDKKFYGKYHGKLINKPIVFLINQYSASAAEILAGAVKDYKKAYFIGTKTFGKGSIQWPAKLSNNDILKLTIDRFYTPKMNVVDNVGISPDLNISDDKAILNTAELLLDTNYSISDNRGYVKINFNNKTVILKISRAEDANYWETYMGLLKLATRNGSVLFGNGRGWTPASKIYLDNVAKMYYPNYQEVSKIDNVNVDAEFSIKFQNSIKKDSINDKNIELINIKSGARIPIKIKEPNDKSLVITPINDLETNSTYYIVVHADLINKNNNQAYGLIHEVNTLRL